MIKKVKVIKIRNIKKGIYPLFPENNNNLNINMNENDKTISDNQNQENESNIFFKILFLEIIKINI